jgi:hypothetical protein
MKRMKLTTWIVIGMVLGNATGYACNHQGCVRFLRAGDRAVHAPDQDDRRAARLYDPCRGRRANDDSRTISIAN